MNVKNYRLKNNLYRAKVRLQHPWPVWKRSGGIAAVVIRKDGTKEDLGMVSDVWAKRWGAETK